MRTTSAWMRNTLAAGFLAGLTLTLSGQTAAPAASDRNPFSGDPKATTDGAVLFRQDCMYCHGVAARGGMRGPDLTTGSWNHGGSDAEIAATVKGGVPGTAMPASTMTQDEIWKIVAYLRTVQQPA